MSLSAEARNMKKYRGGIIYTNENPSLDEVDLLSKSALSGIVAPGVGFEPTRPRWATGCLYSMGTPGLSYSMQESAPYLISRLEALGDPGFPSLCLSLILEVYNVSTENSKHDVTDVSNVQRYHRAIDSGVLSV